jgi:hypothetical protein
MSRQECRSLTQSKRRVGLTVDSFGSRSQGDVEDPPMGVRGPSAAPECGERRLLEADDALTCRVWGWR